MIGLTKEATFFKICNASFARGKSARWEYDKTRGSISGIVTAPALPAEHSLFASARDWETESGLLISGVIVYKGREMKRRKVEWSLLPEKAWRS